MAYLKPQWLPLGQRGPMKVPFAPYWARNYQDNPGCREAGCHSITILITTEQGLCRKKLSFAPSEKAHAIGLTSHIKCRSTLHVAGWLPLTQCWSKGKTELTFWKGQSKLQLSAMPWSCKEGKAHHVADPQQRRVTMKERSVWLPCYSEFKKERLLHPTKREIFCIFAEYFFMTWLTLWLTLGQASEVLLTREGGMWNIAYFILRERKGKATDMLTWPAHF